MIYFTIAKQLSRVVGCLYVSGLFYGTRITDFMKVNMIESIRLDIKAVTYNKRHRVMCRCFLRSKKLSNGSQIEID